MSFFALLKLITSIPYILSFLILGLLTLIGYIVGSLPTAYWFSKLFFGINITKHGSGNSGATNVGRVLGRPYFVLIFLIDALKAYGCLFICSTYMMHLPIMVYSDDYIVLIMAMALLIGNRFSPFLNFRGGKGVSTAVGIVSFVAPYTSIVLFCLAWLVLINATHYPSLGSLASMFLTTVHFFARNNPSTSLIFLFIFMNCWLVFTHLSNIRKHAQSQSI